MCGWSHQRHLIPHVLSIANRKNEYVKCVCGYFVFTLNLQQVFCQVSKLTHTMCVFLLLTFLTSFNSFFQAHLSPFIVWNCNTTQISCFKRFINKIYFFIQLLIVTEIISRRYWRGNFHFICYVKSKLMLLAQMIQFSR